MQEGASDFFPRHGQWGGLSSLLRQNDRSRPSGRADRTVAIAFLWETSTSHGKTLRAEGENE